MPNISEIDHVVRRSAPVCSVFDCGSRDALGGLALAHRLGARELHVFAYDPAVVERCCAIVSHAVLPPKIYLNPLAATESDGYLDLVPGALTGPAGENRRAVRVRSVTLDAYCAAHGAPDLLRIGSPEDGLRALRGAAGILPSVRAVLLADTFPPGYSGQRLFREIHRLLRDRFRPARPDGRQAFPEGVLYINRSPASGRRAPTVQ